MLLTLIALSLLAAQPAPDGEAPTATAGPALQPYPSAPPPAQPRTRIEFNVSGPIQRAPPSEDSGLDAANRAAIARAEAQGRAANAPQGEWPDDSGKRRCRQTTTGFACGNSDKAIDEQEAAMKARLDSMNTPD